MEKLLSNEGLSLIVNQLSRFLDLKSLSQCRLVCKSWRDLIDNDRQWLVFQLEHIHSLEKTFVAEEKPSVKTTIKERFPEWYAFIQQIWRKQTIPRLKEFIKQMWIYFEDDGIYNRNPLHYATDESNLEFVKLLVECGIDLTMPTSNGCTPVHYACGSGHAEAVELLIKCGVQGNDLKSIDSDGCTPMHYACLDGTTETVKLLIKNGVKGNDLETKDNDGYTPFHLACNHGSIEMVKLLLMHAPTLDATARTNKGETIFHLAAGNSDPHVLKWALDNFKFQDLQDENGGRMIHNAVAFGPRETIQFLLESREKIGFNLEERAIQGETVLHLACEKRDIEIVDLVFEALEKIGSEIEFGT